MDWISVSDRTPDTNTEGHSHDVLVYVRNNCTKRAGISVGQLREGEWWSKTIDRGGKIPRGCEVTHWMKLPNLPAEAADAEKVYSCAEIAEMYRVKVSTVWNWIRMGMLDAVRIGGVYQIRAVDLEMFVKENGTVATLNGG